MGILAAVTSFNIGTGAAGTTVAVSGLGFKPKVLKFFWSGRTTTGQGGATAHRGWGWAIDPTLFPSSAFHHWCDDHYDQDAVGTAITARSVRTDGCVTEADATSGMVGYADVQSWDSGGFTLEILDAFATDLRVTVLALGGTSLTHAEIGAFEDPGGAADINVVNLAGFRPDVTFATTYDTATLPIDAPDGFVRGTYGVATDSGEFGYADRSQDASGTGATNRWAGGGFLPVYTGTDTLGTRLDFVSHNSDGFSLTHADANLFVTRIAWLSIKGGRWTTGSMGTQADTTTDMAATCGFRPKAMMFISSGLTALAGTSTAVHCHWSVGLATGTATQHAHQYSSRDGNTTMFVQTAHYTDGIYTRVNPTNDALDGRAHVFSVSNSGFVCRMLDADPSAADIFWVAVGDPPAPVFRRPSTSQAALLRR